jgi:ribosomal protein L24
MHNDYVRITAGENKGKFGSLVTVLETTPEPKFVLELESGFDIVVLQSEIEHANT